MKSVGLLLPLRTERNKNRLKNVFYRHYHSNQHISDHRHLAPDSHQDRILLGYTSLDYYLLIGLASLAAALFIENTIISAVVGVFGASALWGIGELFQQKKRVEKGWFPKNPKRRY